MKHILVTLAIALLAAEALGQPLIQWQKTFGGTKYDEARSIQQTDDGGFILTGNALSNNGDVSGHHGLMDFWVIKTDSSGNILWKRAFGGSGVDWPYDIKKTSDGGYLVVGFTNSEDGNVLGNHGDYDVWVIKLSSDGGLEWQKCMGGSGWDEARSIALTLDGGYIITGHSNSIDGDAIGNPGGSLNYWIVKINPLGTIEWQKSFGGSFNETALSVKQTVDGGYIIAGESQSNDGDITNNQGDYDFWITKLSPAGDLEWQKSIGGTALDVGKDIIETIDGFIALGFVSSNNGDIIGHHGSFDYWIAKLGKTGDIIWQKNLGGSDADWLYAGTPTVDGGIVVAGPTRSTDGDILENIGGQDVWIVKINNSGDVVWQKTIGGTNAESCFSIQQTTDEGFILAGSTWSNDNGVPGSQGYTDFWIVKLAPESTPTTEAPTIAPLEIYPNPAHNTITLQTTTLEPALQITITDMLGRTIQRPNPQNGKDVDVSTLASGMYIITATAPSGKTYSGTFKKE